MGISTCESTIYWLDCNGPLREDGKGNLCCPNLDSIEIGHTKDKEHIVATLEAYGWLEMGGKHYCEECRQVHDRHRKEKAAEAKKRKEMRATGKLPLPGQVGLFDGEVVEG